MSFSFNSQINKEENTTKYSIQIETDNKEQYLFMQEMARECIDGKHKETCNEEYLKELQDTLKKYSYIGPQLSSDSTSVHIPNCCKNCPNHPSNGGSGICNCAAPAMEQDYYTYTTTTMASNSSIIGDQK